MENVFCLCIIFSFQCFPQDFVRLQVASRMNLHIYDVIMTSLRSDEFWHFRSVLLYELSHIVMQLNAQFLKIQDFYSSHT